MILKIIDNKFRCVIPKNERIILGLKQGDYLEVEVTRVIPKEKK